MEKRFGALTSSSDPTQVANTVKGTILALSSVIILIAGQVGVPFAETDVANFAQNVGFAAGGLWALYGLLMKVVVHFSEKK